MSSKKSPLDHMRMVVQQYDQLSTDPQAQQAYLDVMGLDHGMVAAYRDVLLNTDARKSAPRPARNPIGRQRVATITVTFTVRLSC
ncbi:hypothetical protein [Streptomyces sclerotialus]|uniref:hypothetical protein n=1 Tax=Streptomyces sclerotialus TaxID=1957 RepID=UPI0004C93E60